MGLAERRAAKQFETETYPGLKKNIDAAAGHEVTIEVDWESLTLDGQAHLYAESWPKVFFEPLAEAFKAICIDQMGKDALKKSLKKVVVHNKGGIYYGDRMSKLESGVLTLDHEPTTNIGDVADRIRGIQKTLEEGI